MLVDVVRIVVHRIGMLDERPEPLGASQARRLLPEDIFPVFKAAFLENAYEMAWDGVLLLPADDVRDVHADVTAVVKDAVAFFEYLVHGPEVGLVFVDGADVLGSIVLDIEIRRAGYNELYRAVLYLSHVPRIADNHGALGHGYIDISLGYFMIDAKFDGGMRKEDLL